MKKTINLDQYTFEVVESVPDENYSIWSIGKNMIDGYLPLVQVIPGTYDIDVNTMKAIKVSEAQVILSVTTLGQNTVRKMENYIKRYSSSKRRVTQIRVERIKKALKVMYTIKGVENLK